MQHFTYEKPSGHLRQGDLLRLTPDLKALLAEVHAYYAHHPDYHFLLVLTQTCDLVRRDGQSCKSPYISVAAVRPLKTLLDRRLQKMQRSNTEKRGAFAAEWANKQMRILVERLLNNNEPGFFYLHEEPETPLTEGHVAFLTLSIALKTDHYDKCLEARVLGLKGSFQAKLGWLVGNIYSRVATEDWVPETCSDSEFGQRVEEIIQRLGVVWVPDSDLEKVKARVKRTAKERDVTVAPELVLEVVRGLEEEREQRTDKMAERAAAVLQAAKIAKTPGDIDRYRRLLAGDMKFRGLIR